MKSNRHEKILEIIKNYDVETQEELIIRLKENGYNVTQATVSRDIRDLRLTKTMDAAGNYKYTLPTSALRKADVYSETLARSIKKAAIASNLIVVWLRRSQPEWIHMTAMKYSDASRETTQYLSFLRMLKRHRRILKK